MTRRVPPKHHSPLQASLSSVSPAKILGQPPQLLLLVCIFTESEEFGNLDII